MLEHSRGTLLVWALAVVIAGALAWKTLAGGAAGEPAAIRIDGARGAHADADPGAGAASPAPGPATRGIYVHVAGGVRRPGLLRVPAGSRVAAAVERAGGFSRRADVAAVNLAARLEDGQQVVIPPAGAAGAASSTAGGGGAGGTAGGHVPINLGTAGVDQLDEIDGIGPTLAERIVAYRDEQGGLSSVGELREVEGIGEKRFAALRDALGP